VFNGPTSKGREKEGGKGRRRGRERKGEGKAYDPTKP